MYFWTSKVGEGLLGYWLLPYIFELSISSLKVRICLKTLSYFNPVWCIFGLRGDGRTTVLHFWSFELFIKGESLSQRNCQISGLLDALLNWRGSGLIFLVIWFVYQSRKSISQKFSVFRPVWYIFGLQEGMKLLAYIFHRLVRLTKSEVCQKNFQFSGLLDAILDFEGKKREEHWLMFLYFWSVYRRAESISKNRQISGLLDVFFDSERGWEGTIGLYFCTFVRLSFLTSEQCILIHKTSLFLYILFKKKNFILEFTWMKR